MAKKYTIKKIEGHKVYKEHFRKDPVVRDGDTIELTEEHLTAEETENRLKELEATGTQPAKTETNFKVRTKHA